MLNTTKDLPIDNMVFSSPVTDGLNVVHHTVRVGGALLKRDEIYFSLVGAGATIIPLVYKLTSILQVTEITTPT